MNSTMTRKAFIGLLFPAVLLSSCLIPARPVSKEEALALAHRIERSVAKHEYVVLNNIFDEKTLSDRIADAGGVFLNRDLIKGAAQGFTNGQFGKAVVQAMGSTGTYQLVRQYEKDNKQHILFRLYGDGSVNYHDYELFKKDDIVKAADIYVYISGENISKSLADALQLVNKDMSKEALEKVNRIKTIRGLIGQGNYEKASQYYEEYPAAFKREKSFQLIHIQICSKMDNDKYLQAMLEYKSLFPDDPNMYLMMVDAYILQKDYPGALAAVNKLDSLLGKDPYQEYQRGLLYKLMKDTARAQECFERFHASMPEFKKGTIELIASYLRTKNKDKAIQLFKQAKDSNYLNQNNLALIYSYYPDLRRYLDEDSLKRAVK